MATAPATIVGAMVSSDELAGRIHEHTHIENGTLKHLHSDVAWARCAILATFEDERGRPYTTTAERPEGDEVVLDQVHGAVPTFCVGTDGRKLVGPSHKANRVKELLEGVVGHEADKSTEGYRHDA